MSNPETHEAEQAALTARYEALCPAGKKLHDDFDVHLDDMPSDPDTALMEMMGMAKYDEWRADVSDLSLKGEA